MTRQVYLLGKVFSNAAVPQEDDLSDEDHTVFGMENNSDDTFFYPKQDLKVLEEDDEGKELMEVYKEM